MNLSTADLLAVVGLDHPRARERLRTLPTEELLTHVPHTHPLARERFALLRGMAVGAETCRSTEPFNTPNAPASGVYEREDARAIVAKVLGACRATGTDGPNGEGREGEEHGGGAERGEQHRVNLTSAKRARQL